jgi:hypothetical protein
MLIFGQLLATGKNGRWMKPKKTDFNALKATMIFKNNGGHFEMGDAHLSFEDETRTVEWTVYENNHSVDRARETPLAAFFFKFLEKVKWRGNTGGSVAYMDEYMSEDGPVEPSYRNMHGFAKKAHDDMMQAMFKSHRRRARRK